MSFPLVISNAGPSRLARFRAGYGIEAGGVDWNGDHTFSQSAVDFGLQEYIEPEVVRKNPQLTSTEVHLEATRILALRLAQDQSFDWKEAQREEDMVTKWEVADVDGKKQLVTRYGDRHVSLEELWRHTEEFALRVGKPEAFNWAEMQTQLAVQDALISGQATSVALTLSHPESVRYVQKWQQGADGAFYSTQIDIGKHAGRDLRHDEVKEFLDRVRDQYRDTAIDVEGAVAGSYVAVHGAMETAAITKTAKLHTITKGGELFGGRFYSSEHTSLSGPDASDRAFPLWVIRDRRWFGGYNGEDEGAKTRLRQEGSSDDKLLQKEYEERRAARNSLHIVTETGVAVHAAPVILTRLAEKLPESAWAVEKSIRRHEGKELRIKNYELRKKKREARKYRERVQFFKTERIERFDKTKEHRRRGKRGSENGFPPRRAVAEVLTSATSEKREKLKKRRVWQERREQMGPRKRLERLRRVARRAEKREKTLWVALAVAGSEFAKLASRRQLASRRWERQRRRGVARVTREGLSSKPGPASPAGRLEAESCKVQKERAAVAGVWFGWMVWMMVGSKLTPLASHGRAFMEETREQNFINKLQGVALQSQEGTPWVLLSIIWYLAAIRENGLLILKIKNQKSKRKKGKKKRGQTLPRYAVIFAFRS